MAKTTRLVKSFFRLLLPIVILLVLATVGGSVWLIYKMARPATYAYLVTPDKYGQLSSRASQVTDETWTNKDGTTTRGWLLKGNPNAPAVILLHRYGTDRSHVLDLGVKLSEALNCTVLMPDQRGHGDKPLVKYTTFGGRESEDLDAMIDYLRGLKTPESTPLVGKNIGVYGVEMGAVAALLSAARQQDIKALALDSTPQDSDALLTESVNKRYPFMSVVTAKLATVGTYLYFYEGSYKRDVLCDTARSLANRKVMVVGGLDAPVYRDSSNKLGKCFPSTTTVEIKTDMSPSSFGMRNASLEQSEAYDMRVIDFFRQNLDS